MITYLALFAVVAGFIFLESYLRSEPELYRTKAYKAYIVMLVAIWIGTSVFLFKTMPLITLALGVGAIFSFYEKYLLSQGRGIPSAFKRLKIVGYFVAAAVIAFLFYDVL